MSKFNTPRLRTTGRGPLTSESAPSGRTYEGGPGYARDAKSELFLLAVSNMVSESSFYESADARDERFRALVHQVAVTDPEWLLGMIGWLRGEGNLRSASVVAALEGAKARVDAGAHGHSRQMVDSALQRADEPGEALAYWTSRYGRAIPKPVKRGVADAVQRLYNERSLLKYDTGSRGFRFSDVLNLVHPSPAADRPSQGDLFSHAHDRRHGRDTEIPASLGMLRARAELMALPVADRRRVLDGHPERLAAAGMTWEALAGWLQGPMDARAWEAVIPNMGYMALLRNLRNFDEAGVSDTVAARVAAKLADADEVAKSRQLPMRFLSAYRAAPSLRWGHALETALGHCLANVPALPGRTLILVDQSGSMCSRLSARSDLTCSAAAQVFGAALALRAESADLVQFDNTSTAVPVRRGDALLRVTERFWGPRGGTSTADAVRRQYRRHDRVVIVTDEQAHYGQDPTREVPDSVPVYTWNLAGYRYGHGPSGERNRHLFGGLSDAAFRMVPLIEAGQTAQWPWES
ncbi:TROVE domain-containing protein [Marinactinospora rubrisoli]|uniref:TROVE domain-containing protein n=1 Tax=Marinactinospora rubrisoli TaxID=2715399 RepID=A0ABW2KM59_9ACTN